MSCYKLRAVTVKRKVLRGLHFRNYHMLQAADIDAAASYLESQSKIPSGLAGHSKGGSSVLLYSAKYGCIPRVANISGRFDHKRGDAPISRFCI